MAIPTISPSDFCRRTFDYLIVGGGTAGLVVAARLSENPNIVVGVLEAGPAVLDKPAIDIPGRYGEGLATDWDWRFETTPQPGLRGRKLPWARGKLLGGTSALNFMTWNRPNREDLDAWEELGNKGWGWDSLLPFYKMTEDFIAPTATQQEQHKCYYDPTFMGANGPVPIMYMREYSHSHQFWHDTLNNLGIPTNKSHLSGSNVGVWTNLSTVYPTTMARAYSTNAYYLPHSGRANLILLTNAMAQEVVIEQCKGEWVAKGIRFSCGTEEFTAMASNEVILSAGSVQSPQLLELSGIGNPSVLDAAGIPVKINNPNVGENLQEHMMTATIYEIDPTIRTRDDLKTDPALAAAADEAYENERVGPRTILPVSLCYLPLSHFIPRETLNTFATRASDSWNMSPQRRQICTRRLSEVQRLGQVEYIFDVGNWSHFMPREPGKKYATMLQIHQYPFSRGSVHIPPKGGAPMTTADAKPVIDPQYYGGPGGGVDFDIKLHCLRYGFKIAKTAPLSNLIKARAWPPEKELSDEAEDEDLKRWLIDNTITDWHPVGSCGMGGNEGIKGGVVDERLRVYGVKRLRVVDASVMPLQIAGHLQATIYAMAEKASKMILEEGGY